MSAKKPERWSYSGDPTSSSRDAVRFLIGDTDPKDAQLDDKEIDYLVTNEGNALNAAICAAVSLGAKYARLYDESTGKTSSGRGSMSEHYYTLAAELRRKRDAKIVVPYAGGMSEAEKEVDKSNDDLPQPAFRRDTHDRQSDLPDLTRR